MYWQLNSVCTGYMAVKSADVPISFQYQIELLQIVFFDNNLIEAGSDIYRLGLCRCCTKKAPVDVL